MAGTVRKRTRTNRKGETRTTWLADYTDQLGRRHNHTFATQRGVKAWLLTVRGDVRDGLHTPDADSITIAEAAERWLRYCQSEKLERGSLRGYESYVRLYLVPVLGHRK